MFIISHCLIKTQRPAPTLDMRVFSASVHLQIHTHTHLPIKLLHAYLSRKDIQRTHLLTQALQSQPFQTRTEPNMNRLELICRCTGMSHYSVIHSLTLIKAHEVRITANQIIR